MQQPAFGSLVLQEDGSFEYIPDEGFLGRDSFTYITGDVELSSGEARVLIDVGTPQVAMRLEVTDALGQTVQHLVAGESLRLRGWVQDLRDDRYANRGIYAAYFDVLYDAQYMLPLIDAGLPRGFEIDFGPAFHEPGSGNVDQPGLVDEVGSLAVSFDPIGADEVLLFDMPFDLTGPQPQDDQYAVSFNSAGNELDLLTNDLLHVWTAGFSLDGADATPAHDVLLFEPPTAVSQERMVYIDTSVEMRNDAALSLVAVGTSASGGAVELSLDGLGVIYTPPAGFQGTDTFTYMVSDPQGRQAMGTVRVDVSPNWQNLRDPLDVNDDSYISPIDALLVINDLNKRGARPLVEPSTGPPFLDVNGDGSVGPLDALLVVNYLNELSDAGEGESSGDVLVTAGHVSPPSDLDFTSLLIEPPVAPIGMRTARPSRTDWSSPIEDPLAAAIVESLPTTDNALHHLSQQRQHRAAAEQACQTLEELLDLLSGNL